jgi:hypothetical protein
MKLPPPDPHATQYDPQRPGVWAIHGPAYLVVCDGQRIMRMPIRRNDEQATA